VSGRDLLTLKDVAAELGRSESTLRVQVRNGVLKATKIGPLNMVTRREMERYRREHMRGTDA
jgi:DNA-binding NarL/FixJ family response regulator